MSNGSDTETGEDDKFIADIGLCLCSATETRGLHVLGQLLYCLLGSDIFLYCLL